MISERGAWGQSPGSSLVLRISSRRAYGRHGDSTEGGGFGAIAAGSPIASVPVRGGANDTTPRPVLGAGCGSQPLPIFPLIVVVEKDHGRRSLPVMVSLTLLR